MPYYFGEGEPGWDEYMEAQESGTVPGSRRDLFAYVEPWEAKTSVLTFARNPPPLPQSTSDKPPSAAPAVAGLPEKKRNILSWLFGEKAPQPHAAGKPEAAPKIEIGSKEWLANFQAEQRRQAEAALHRVAVMAEALRQAGVARVLIRYDGGNDEGFTHLEALEMKDGRRLIPANEAGRESMIEPLRAACVAVYGQDAGTRYGPDQALAEFKKWGHFDLVDQAAVAFVGPGFGTGPYELFGAITLDCEACTLTDEKDPARSFPAGGAEGT